MNFGATTIHAQTAAVMWHVDSELALQPIAQATSEMLVLLVVHGNLSPFVSVKSCRDRSALPWCRR